MNAPPRVSVIITTYNRRAMPSGESKRAGPKLQQRFHCFTLDKLLYSFL